MTSLRSIHDNNGTSDDQAERSSSHSAELTGRKFTVWEKKNHHHHPSPNTSRSNSHSNFLSAAGTPVNEVVDSNHLQLPPGRHHHHHHDNDDGDGGGYDSDGRENGIHHAV
jgi:hypothetical protein